MKEVILMSEVALGTAGGLKYNPASLMDMPQGIDDNVADAVIGLAIAGASAFALMHENVRNKGLDYAFMLLFGYGAGAGLKGLFGLAGISL